LEYNQIDTIAMILEALSYKDGQNRVIHTRFLSDDKLSRYFQVLLEYDLLVYEEEKKSYKTTDKGTDFLRTYNQVGELVTPIGV
jgi:predicted transcriptional regulator